ncbi:MAG: alpha/beta hydrolase [Candidatus Rokuibacteriota bacterium]|nr:MAG: alpha/beta hydrolase [Candidatus Rokubacteria bacterium]
MRAQVNGIAIDYEVTGDGPVVLLGHGYGSTRHMWDEQHRALADRWRVVSWDMRGHGQTDSPDDPARYSAALTVADMRALLQHLGVERAVIGGLSLGGYVSLAFVLAHPEMTRALVICDSGPGYRNAEARAQWNQRAHERAANLEAKGLEALARRSRETQQAVHRSAQGLAHAARGMLAQEGSQVIDGLGSIRVPTLVIVGDQDQPFVAPSEYMAKKIPGARLEVIPGAGHSSNLDQPETFNRVLREFLASL